MSNKRVPIAVKVYMANLGKRGGNRRTPAQRAACERNLAAARIGRIQRLLDAEGDPERQAGFRKTLRALRAKLAA